MSQAPKVEWNYEREDDEYYALYGVNGRAVIYRDRTDKIWRAVATYGVPAEAEGERWHDKDMSKLFPLVEAWLQKHLA